MEELKESGLSTDELRKKLYGPDVDPEFKKHFDSLMSDIKTVINSFRAKHESKNTQIKSAVKKLDNLSNEEQDAISTLKNLKAQITTQQNRIDKLTSELEEAKKTSKPEEDIKKLEAELKKLNEEKDNSSKLINENESKIKQLEDEIERLTTALDAHKQETDSSALPPQLLTLLRDGAKADEFVSMILQLFGKKNEKTKLSRVESAIYETVVKSKAGEKIEEELESEFNNAIVDARSKGRKLYDVLQT